MFNEQKYLDIHRELAEKHVMLKHDVDVNVAWVGLDDGEDAFFAKTKAPFLMAMIPVSGGMDGDADAFKPIVRGGFELLGKVVSGAQVDYRKIEEVSNQAMVIGMECIIRLNEMAVGNLCDTQECKCVLGAFDPKTVNFDRIVGGKGWYGYRFVYTLGSADVLEYDASRWLE